MARSRSTILLTSMGKSISLFTILTLCGRCTDRSRLTPLASGSSRHSPSVINDSLRTGLSPPRSLSAASSSQPPPSLFNASPLPSAEIGLSTLGTEIQLRESAMGKDRMFLLLLSRELETMIARITQGNLPEDYVPPVAPTGTLLAQIAPAFPLTTTTTSKYQRMLVYKAAEWYGLKGVAAPDGGIYIGVLGTLDPRAADLHLSSLAPKPPSPKQSFKIMQRVPLGSSSGASSRQGSSVGDDGSEAGTSKRKTLEEREAEYALAKERIYGSSSSSAAPSEPGVADEEELRGRSVQQRAHHDDEIDPVPRHPYGANGLPAYPSLYHPGSDGQVPGQMPSQAYQTPDSMFAFGPNAGHGYGVGGMGYSVYPPAGGYGNGHSPFIQHTGFGPQWQPQMMPGQNMGMGGPHDWGYNGGPMPGAPGGPNQPMPMIPQGSMPAYPHGYGFGYQQQQMGYAPVPLVQPTPTRPGPYPVPQPHSSNSSSISSRSYQDYSRPHSRGSTTSTRSAASSVRLGVMYPVGQPSGGHGYRQKGIKGQNYNNMPGPGAGTGPGISLGVSDKRSARGHSPSSATTTSSRSSRKTTSIPVQQPLPGQHQLPQRPDWAADNVPYHPSPIPMPGGLAPSTPNVSDFPPLLRHGTNAEPMQVERVKTRAPSGTVWNGAGGQAIQPHAQAQAQSPAQVQAQVQAQAQAQALAHAQAQARAQMQTPTLSHSTTTSQIDSADFSPSIQATSPSVPPSEIRSISPSLDDVSAPSQSDFDVDFPRRSTTRSTSRLFDPSAPKVESTPRADSTSASGASQGAGTGARQGAGAGPGAVAGATAGTAGTGAGPGEGAGSYNGTGEMTTEEAIEAKLAALSVSSGISIGPAPPKAPSYAKIVRRA